MEARNLRRPGGKVVEKAWKQGSLEAKVAEEVGSQKPKEAGETR